MQISCSLLGITDGRHPRQGIEDISRAEFTNVLLDVGTICTTYGLEQARYNANFLEAELLKNPTRIRKYLQNIWNELEQHQLVAKVVRTPMLYMISRCEEYNDFIREISREIVEELVQHSFEYLIVPPLVITTGRADSWQINKMYYRELMLTMKKWGGSGKILIQNQCNNINGHFVRGIFCDEDKILQFIEELNAEVGQELIGHCIDIGVLNLCGQELGNYAKTLKPYIKAVIVRENDGHKEESMLPFSCTYRGHSQMNWLSIIRSLREIGFDEHLILEFKDTANSFSPLLRPQLMQLAKSVADYLKWQIELENLIKKYPSIVLFGAGNMCRNYMASYGEAYPPLFTCDNNSDRWGTTICGLEIKDPKVLKELSPECAIFICNVYYRDIEKQLRDMGITNPIEYFNDEYAPRLYVG